MAKITGWKLFQLIINWLKGCFDFLLNILYDGGRRMTYFQRIVAGFLKRTAFAVNRKMSAWTLFQIHGLTPLRASNVLMMISATLYLSKNNWNAIRTWLSFVLPVSPTLATCISTEKIAGIVYLYPAGFPLIIGALWIISSLDTWLIFLEWGRMPNLPLISWIWRSVLVCAFSNDNGVCVKFLQIYPAPETPILFSASYVFNFSDRRHVLKFTWYIKCFPSQILPYVICFFCHFSRCCSAVFKNL